MASTTGPPMNNNNINPSGCNRCKMKRQWCNGMNQDNEDPRCQQCRQAKIKQCLPGSKPSAHNPAAPGTVKSRNTWRARMSEANKARWQADNARRQAENANAALNRQIAELQRQSQEQSNLLKARHRQELDKLRMTIQQHMNDKRRLETQIQTLGDRSESIPESIAELRHQLASLLESLQVTQKNLYEKQNEQIEQQQAIDDARDRDIAELQRSLLKPPPAKQQNLSQSPNPQALLNPAAVGQQNLTQFPKPNQRGSTEMPLMGQMPNSFNPPISQPNALNGQSTMSNPQLQPSQGGTGCGNYGYPGTYAYSSNYGYPGNYGNPSNYGCPGNHGNQKDNGNQSNDGNQTNNGGQRSEDGA
ncbi:hypothetical protein KC318_g2998 [Hortaea werneckii]|nr:hypothetical protein KC334_g3708 [Hortaea werneckii]KAI7018907.1 hypothetical protein KC355_g3198 [Hortaea werneckii]KAI7672227.1 hypothetical protein KC318_g2998 [Hortaea werneckii]